MFNTNLIERKRKGFFPARQLILDKIPKTRVVIMLHSPYQVVNTSSL